jgi:hypothetical protein
VDPAHAGNLQAQLHVPSIGCTVALADVYDRLVFPTAAAL